MSFRPDFTKWTDAQLYHLGSFHVAESLAEIERRKAAGTWQTDGSMERVARLIRDNSKPKRRRK